jgi:hypothetical protein
VNETLAVFPRASSSPAGAATISEFTHHGTLGGGGEHERSRVRALVRDGRSETGSSILEQLCRVALGELGMWGVVISLMTLGEQGRDQTGTIAAASSEQARAVEELEFSLGEGPGTDAFVASHPILTPDLERALERWPGYAPAAYGSSVPTDLPHSPTHDRRDEIYQAQGMVMVQLEITLEQSLARMRGHAFAAGQELADLAADILAGRVALQPDPDGAP